MKRESASFRRSFIYSGSWLYVFKAHISWIMSFYTQCTMYIVHGLMKPHILCKKSLRNNGFFMCMTLYFACDAIKRGNNPSQKKSYKWSRKEKQFSTFSVS